MKYTIKEIFDGKKYKLSFAAIPAETTILDLSCRQLGFKTHVELTEAFKCFPKTLTSLNLQKNCLWEKTGSELASLFRLFPADLRSLSLRENNLAEKTADELVEAFSALPKNLTSLDLGVNYLGSKTTDELIKIFSALPENLTSLKLRVNYLEKRSGAELNAILKALPKGLTSLNLSQNRFDTTGRLEEIFKGLPRSLRSLKLSCTRLGNIRPAILRGAFHALPELSYLNLRSVDLDKQTGDDLANLFQVLPESLTSLDLSGNNLCLKTGEELAAAFSNLPKSLASLNLNATFKYGGNQVIVSALKALPASITSLNLGENYLASAHRCLDLVEIVRALPQSLTSLDLSGNNLCLKTGEELAEVFKGLLSNVTTLNLSDNRLKLADIIGIIPSSVQVIILSKDNIVYREQYWVNQLQKKLTDILQNSTGDEILTFSNITLEKEIDETFLNKLISQLEIEATPLAFLMAALLLDGQIPTVCDVDNIVDLDAYLEKRTHDAITFYLKAAEDAHLKPVINFILWEMRTAAKIPSIQSRLACLDIALPVDYMPTLNNHKIPSHVLKMLFFRPVSLAPQPDIEQKIAENNSPNIIDLRLSS